MRLLSSKHQHHALQAIAHYPKLALAQWRYVSAARHVPMPVLPAEAKKAQDAQSRELSFTFCVIALCAQVAKNNNAVSEHAYAAFRAGFPLRGEVCGKLRELFALACADSASFTRYTAQIRHAFPGQPTLLVALMEWLFRIAAADGAITCEKEQILAAIAHSLGLPAAAYAALYRRHSRCALAHEVLEIDRRAEGASVKKRYYALMREIHPDRFAAQELSPELKLVLCLRAAEVNAAYRSLTRNAA